MGKKIIIIMAITLVVFALSCSSTRQATVKTISDISTREQLFWNHFQKEVCDSLGWVNPREFSTYEFVSIESILSWGENLWIGFVETKDYCIGNINIIVMQWSLGSGVWRPFFTVFKKNETKWQLCTAKIFSQDYWGKIKIIQNDEREEFTFIVDDRSISKLYYSQIISLR